MLWDMCPQWCALANKELKIPDCSCQYLVHNSFTSCSCANDLECRASHSRTATTVLTSSFPRAATPNQTDNQPQIVRPIHNTHANAVEFENFHNIDFTARHTGAPTTPHATLEQAIKIYSDAWIMFCSSIGHQVVQRIKCHNTKRTNRNCLHSSWVLWKHFVARKPRLVRYLLSRQACTCHGRGKLRPVLSIRR